MSQLTNFGENKFCDYIRNTVMPLPSAWHIAALSAYSDSSVTEITGAGLTRAEVTRSLANFAGTQGDGTTLASTGTSHRTSNNNVVSLGTASGSATIVALGFFDDDTGGDCWMVWELAVPLEVVISDDVEFPASMIKFELGLGGGNLSDYFANKLIDYVFRGQFFSPYITIYHALYTSAPTNAGGGSEVGGGVGYARAPLICSTGNISGTQASGSTSASSGTSGEISNNIDISHPEPTGPWGTVTHGAWRDASSGGNLLWWNELDTPLSIGLGTPAPTYEPTAARFGFQ